MADFTKDIQYFYCPDYKKYVKFEKGLFYCIENNKEIQNSFYDKILIGSIYTKDITKEKYYAQIN
ncbi:hypothetical protein HMPREF3181_01447 [Parvimonas sp. KA00067]|uniref:hypothetical protein n=1 Tax=Parvimonas sp. KA00067 TaxID=1588755 RepID=UPI00079AE95D|nr:hypothetical protein [Parvimonas sp. KA00067]KXB64591.1 hypothetical protein HMPREF3181_01447 [Parvimonas sp. KA00067]